METFLKVYLPTFLVAYLLITFVIPSVRVYKKTGINPITFGKSGNAHDYIGVIMKALTGLLIVVVLLFSVTETVYQFLSPISFLEKEWLKYMGLIMIHTSLIWIVVAQNQMQQSWRIGIDSNHKTLLVTTGVFGMCRNPVFLGMIISTAGIFLIIPNAISFFIACTSYIIIQIQIRLEEEHLQKVHGTDYMKYKQKVKRLI